jgi:DNA-binding transcriptional MerR regulator
MMTGKDDDAATIREDSFLGELIPQVAEHLAEQHAGDFDAEVGQARFRIWLAAHTKEPAALAMARTGASRASMSLADGQGLLFGEEPPVSPEGVGYRGPTAAVAAGITYRQLDYWARTGLVEPSVRSASGSGSQRLYGFRDILVLKIVKRLLDTGISLQQIRTAVAYLREQGAADMAQVTLMSDGGTVYACTSPDEVVDLLQGGQGVFGIALGRIWQEVEGTLADLPAERAEGAGAAAADGAGPGSAGVGPDELARRRARRTG